MKLLAHVRPAFALRAYANHQEGDHFVLRRTNPTGTTVANAPRGTELNRQRYAHYTRTTHLFSSDGSRIEEDRTVETKTLASSSKSFSLHTSFDEELIDNYDAFILDQFGVLHDGVKALPGAVELCEYLHRTKRKKLIVLSNTSAPADKCLEKLPRLGFDANFFAGAVTSGEEASRYIREKYGRSRSDKRDADDDRNSSAITRRALMLTWDVSVDNNPRLTALPEAFLEQCGTTVQVANSVEEADFLLLHGSEVWYRGGAGGGTRGGSCDDDQEQHLLQESLGGFIETGDFSAVDQILKACLERRLPAVCANPDFVVQTPTGDGVAYMPGKIARRYQEMGGDCSTFGKPAREHFQACVEKLGMQENRSRVCHVGDSLHHDIYGANNAGIPNVFISSGIHRQDLEADFGVLPHLDALDRLFDEEGSVVPSHVVPAFRL